jgi:GntR family transcriptional regulator, trigonelline degradation regulator
LDFGADELEARVPVSPELLATPVPPEKAIEERLGVSRTVVREALRQL